MIKAGVGFSNDLDAGEASVEATRKALEHADVYKSDFALVFCTFHHMSQFKQVISNVCSVSGTDNVSGCSALGIIAGFEEVEGDPGIAVLVVESDTVRSKTFLSKSKGDGGFSAGVEIGDMFKSDVDNNQLMTLLPDPFLIHPDLLFKGVESSMGDIGIIGASSSLHPGMNETYQFAGDRIEKGSVSGFMLEGDFSYHIGITQGCQPVGAPMVVTNSEGNIIFELDGKTAYKSLKEQVPARILNDENNLFNLLFAALPPDPSDTQFHGRDYLVRNIMGINADTGLVAVAENVREGQIIQFAVRHPTMAREDLKQMIEKVQTSLGPEKTAKFGLYFNCCGRGSSLYGQKGIDTAYITGTFGDFPLIGFFGNSEFAFIKDTNHVFTYTGVLALIAE